jgi:L-ascorbate metabolism protein UlaG (beta-lactamase superfamily)
MTRGILRPASIVAASAAAALTFTVSAAFANVNFSKEPACQSDTPTSQGGPAPINRDLLVIRWLGTSNEEFAFRDQVILHDAYYSAYAEKPAHPLGFRPQDVQKASVILVSHGHIDHTEDVPFLAKKLGVKAVGAPVTGEILQKMGMPMDQFVTVTGKGGEVLRYGPVTVQPVLGDHEHVSTVPNWDRVTFAIGEAHKILQDSVGASRSREKEAEWWKKAGPTADPRVLKEGSIVYVMDFDGFKLVMKGGAQDPTQYERDIAAKTGKIDMLIQAYGSTYDLIPQIAIDAEIPSITLWNPRYLMPTHHDDVGGLVNEAPIEPFFETVREKLPGTRGISAIRKAPVCIDVKTKGFYQGW